jgi:hypothetical protein
MFGWSEMIGKGRRKQFADARGRISTTTWYTPSKRIGRDANILREKVSRRLTSKSYF